MFYSNDICCVKMMRHSFIIASSMFCCSVSMKQNFVFTTMLRSKSLTSVKSLGKIQYPYISGLYQESHGIVGNKMFDPVLNASFRIGTWGRKWWDRGEPIWATVRKQGLKSAVYFWPGSEAQVRENLPNEYRKYNWSVPFEKRVDTVVEWLNKSDMDLAVTYFNEPDRTGHRFGPNAKETEEKVISMDTLLGYLVEKLEYVQLFDTVNLIVTSDHGMAEVDYKQKIIDVSTVVSMETEVERIVGSGPTMQFIPRQGQLERVYENLQKTAKHESL